VLHQIQKVDMRESGLMVKNTDSYTKDNVPVQLSAALFYQVKNAYKACFEVSDHRTGILSV
jgi:regulator of protease activity HflC (stomatin/prohibitin superfamily)